MPTFPNWSNGVQMEEKVQLCIVVLKYMPCSHSLWWIWTHSHVKGTHCHVKGDTLSCQWDTLSCQWDTLSCQRNTLSLSCQWDTLSCQRDTLSCQRDTLSLSYQWDTLSCQRDTLSCQRDTLSCQWDTLSSAAALTEDRCYSLNLCDKVSVVVAFVERAQWCPDKNLHLTFCKPVWQNLDCGSFC